MSNYRVTQKIFFLVLSLFNCAYAAQIQVHVDFKGTVLESTISDYSVGSNPLSGTIDYSYDDTLFTLSSGEQFVSLDSNSINSFKLTIEYGNSTILHKENDASFNVTTEDPVGYPRAQYNNRQFLGLDFYTENFEGFANKVLSMDRDSFEVFSFLDDATADDPEVSGSISYEVTTVPLPAAFWLFFAGSSILAFPSRTKLLKLFLTGKGNQSALAA